MIAVTPHCRAWTIRSALRISQPPQETATSTRGSGHWWRSEDDPGRTADFTSAGSHHQHRRQPALALRAGIQEPGPEPT